MDVTKAKAAISGAQSELKKLVEAEFNARRMAGLPVLARVDKALTLAFERLDDAVARTQPKAPKGEKTASPKKN